MLFTIYYLLFNRKRIINNKYQIVNSTSGLTLVELIVVIGILSLLIAIAFVSVANIRVLTTNTNTISVLASDLKAQQIKAMTGDTEGRGVKDNYGIKILPNEYVFFHGNGYNPADTTNYSFSIGSGYVLSTTLPDQTILFASGSGEVVNFILNQDTITITNSQTNQRRSLRLNQYGTAIEIN